MNIILNKAGEPAHVTQWEYDMWVRKADPNWRVGHAIVGPCEVSTIFARADSSESVLFFEDIIWETMVFRCGDRRELACDRCAGSREQAEAMHARMVLQVQNW